jgi:uncharacterized OB-fold protein
MSSPGQPRPGGAASDVPIARDEPSAPFFDAAADGRLLIRRCAACGHWIAPYMRMGVTLDRCPACTSDRLEWAEASGRGTLVTWTVVHQAGRRRADDEHGAHPVGVVELDEGPWLTARLDADGTDLAAGMELQVAFVRPGGGEPVPVFGPAWRPDRPPG